MMRDKEAQKKYLKARVNGASQRKAAKRANISRATAVRAEHDPRFRTLMAAALERAGATEDKIATVVARNLDAQKIISANIMRRDGMKDADENSKDFIEVPDGQTQLKAAELAGKFRGDFNDASDRIADAFEDWLDAVRAEKGK